LVTVANELTEIKVSDGITSDVDGVALLSFVISVDCCSSWDRVSVSL